MPSLAVIIHYYTVTFEIYSVMYHTMLKYTREDTSMQYAIFKTKLSTFKSAEVTLSDVVDYNDPEKIKKQGRIVISLENTTIKVGFIHGTLIQIGGEGFILAGPSGVGKTTLAHEFVSSDDSRIIANDWVAVECDEGVFYASDLNYEEKILQNDRVRIAGIILLSKHDALYRDAYIPDDAEYRRRFYELFDDMSRDNAKVLASFWTKNIRKLPFYCVLPARDHDLTYTVYTLRLLLRRIRPKDDPVDVGIIGVGAVGTALANGLGQVKNINRVHLYNRSKQVVSGLALDLNQALYRDKADTFVAHDSPEDLFRRSSVVFLAFRDKHSDRLEDNMPERWKRVRPHAEAIKKYAQLAANVGFTGAIFVITNPVDYLAYACYRATRSMPSSLRTFQVYGIGLEGDAARAIFYGQQYTPQLRFKDIEIIGNHADDFIIHAPISREQLDRLSGQVLGASSEVRSHDIRTVFGPVAATMRSFNAYLEGDPVNISIIQHKAYIGRRVKFKFGLPMLISSAIDENHETYQSIVNANNEKIAKYDDLL